MVATMNTQIDGDTLARTAIKALLNPRFTGIPGRCEQFAREVFEAVYPDHSEVTKHFLATARVSMLSFQDTEYNVWENIGGIDHLFPPQDFLKPGDYLYKGFETSGPNGHVGIFFHNQDQQGQPVPCVAENSTFHMSPGAHGNVSGAKGYRSLTEFGPYEMVVRLSEVEI